MLVTLLVTPHMTQLQKLTLNDANMSRRRWTEFFSSLQHATQLTHIDLRCIDLGDAGTLLVKPNMTQLQKVVLYDVKMSGRRWTEFVASLQHATQLTRIELHLIDDGKLLVTHHMTQLQEVELSNVKMSAGRWAKFISSLLTVQHTVHVTLRD